ncbi:hypothetical protein [Paenibacillus nasutitermitis]|uniref:Uncharacterized protein n=1 Tax=Paenibacillus nasutitermitis TaxID=1652958 RepID=A0A917DZL6_9BACL|nr:hypothetical protein [Paenibacillus nasutitermitis]GGD81992.1 hypothetical protein GCM10010911_45130 [Paenibacillus nasutitermitis]
MIKKLIVTGTVLTACIAAGIYYPFLGQSDKILKPVIPNMASYPYVEMEDLVGRADVVAHGIVKKRGKTQIVKIPVSTEIDVTKENEGKFLESVETPVTIEVMDTIKDKEKKKTIIYWEEGGELSDRIVEPDGGFPQEGDEVVIFLNQSGHSWGAQGVLKVNDNQVDVLENKQIRKYNLEDFDTKLKNLVANNK